MRPLRGWRAAVVAAVVLVAGGCGSGTGDGDGDGLTRLPVGGAAAGGAGRSSATMSAEADVASDAAASMIAPAQVVEYRLAAGADAPPETAQAYEVKGAPPADVRAKVAEALQVEVDDVEVGPGGYDWYYSGLAPDTAVSSSVSEEASPPPTVPGVPTADEAEDRVRELLSALGASDEGQFEVFGEDGYNRSVVFTPSVDGIPVAGLQTQVAFGREGRVEYANGLVAEVEAIGEYPLVGLQEAVDRLQNGFGGGGRIATATGGAKAAVAEDTPAAGGGSGGSTGSAGVSGEPAADSPACAPDEPCSSPPSPPTDEPTMTIEPDPAPPTVPLEPEVIEVTGVERSLQLVASGCPGDAVYLVPAFDLQSEAGPVGSVIAVEDDQVAVAGSDDAADLERCPDSPPPDVPLGKPEPAPLPADGGREPATP